MNRIAQTFCLLAVAVVLVSGCGDQEKDLAMYKWTAFEKSEIDKIKTAGVDDKLKPVDFNSRVVEVVGASYRFKGFISYKRGNAFHETSYAFVDKTWKPVAYSDLEEDEETRKEMEEIGEKLAQLKEEISEKEEKMEEYISIFEKLETMMLEVHALEKRLMELKEKQ